MTGRKQVAVLAFTLAICSAATWLVAKEEHPQRAQMDDRQRAIHALSRLTFGTRPGDVDRVLAVGIDKWIDQQLNPKHINDRAIEARLADFRTLNMSSRELVENFPPPLVLKQVADGRKAMPSDPEKRAIYESGIARMRLREQRKQEKDGAELAAATGGDKADLLQKSEDELNGTEQEHRRELRQRALARADELEVMPPQQRMKALIEMPADERLVLARSIPQQERTQLVAGLTPQQKETLIALANPTAVVVGEAQQAKLLRAAYSERQLEEVMTDFWFNHFNVFINKGADNYLVTSYERDVIRPHALGKFKDLLLASAKSPAMLWYLDNWQSVGPNSQAAQFANGARRAGNARPVFRPRPRMGGVWGRRWPYARFDTREPLYQNAPGNARQQQAQKAPRGLNENYAREVMELHTLGVNGGYTQQDVAELARVLTGWTMKNARRNDGQVEYEFNSRMHEPGEKMVLGRKFKEHGEKEGEAALEMLARHPSTARFISTKLATRFVSDNPPQSLIDRMAETFTKTDGDIRQVLRRMFKSPEFWAPEAYRAKVKTPFEFVVSAIRATSADIAEAQPLVQTLNKMGMPIYGSQPPTGYSTKADAWVNSAALLDRFNFALALGTSRFPGVTVDTGRVLPKEVPGQGAAMQALFESVLLSGDVSRQTHDAIQKQMIDPAIIGRGGDSTRAPNTGVIAGLILGSPEFQRR